MQSLLRISCVSPAHLLRIFTFSFNVCCTREFSFHSHKSHQIKFILSTIGTKIIQIGLSIEIRLSYVHATQTTYKFSDIRLVLNKSLSQINKSLSQTHKSNTQVKHTNQTHKSNTQVNKFNINSRWQQFLNQSLSHFHSSILLIISPGHRTSVMLLRTEAGPRT